MEPSPDELAGVVEGFGGLTRTELRGAIDDLAARSGDLADPQSIERAVTTAVADYYLVELEPGTAIEGPTAGELDEDVLVPGPAALPQLPPGGDDLPHLLDVDPRPIDRAAVLGAVESALRADVARTIADGDRERAGALLDACYETEAWGGVDLADAKAGLADLVE